MCGIVGYVGDQDSVSLLLAGLKRLEYRGYDSAGLAVVDKGKLRVVRCQGKLSALESLVAKETVKGTPGIGHTRWATHGKPSNANAHPHAYKGVAIVHNGIIENHLALKEQLKAAGHTFTSETDSEIFAHLISDELEKGKDLAEGFRLALTKVKGSFAIAAVWEKDPTRIVAAKNSSPLVVGAGKGETFLASDVSALLEHTRDVQYLEEGDYVILTREKVAIVDAQGRPVVRPVRRIDWTPLMAEKGGHKHFMHKEIHEQPRAVSDTILGRISVQEGDVWLEGVADEAIKKVSRVVFVACGTSYHAALCGRLMVESLARMPAEAELGSEFRYRDLLVDASTLVVAVSQSGETADTLAALRAAKARGCPSLAIVNVVGSAVARESDGVLYTHAGPEIGVASTKCFTTQLAALYLLAVHLGRLRGTLSQEAAQKALSSLRHVPKLLEEVLRGEESVKKLARVWQQTTDCLFLGRGPGYPVALEGALKLKEISYVHAEGYAAGEMKHGPIALIDPKMPVVVVAPQGPGYEKMIGNIEEVRARGGKVIAICSEGDSDVTRLADHAIRIPQIDPLLAPILAVVPLQLFAYHVADFRGTDVDQPRNLAKSVTVE